MNELLRGRLAATRAAGFTLIELVTVLVILGVLAAVALPRYADLDTAAERSVIDAFVGALKSARLTAYSKLLLANLPYRTLGSVDLDVLVRCDTSDDLSGPFPGSGPSSRMVALAGIRRQVFNDPAASACDTGANTIGFTSRSGRNITISLSSADITWSAAPSY